MADFKVGTHKGKITYVSETGKPWGEGERKTWYYDVKIDSNGTTVEGNIGWKSETPKYKIGDEVTFDKELDPKDKIKFKNMALAVTNAGPSGKGSSYNDPTEIKHTAMSMAQMCAAQTYHELNKEKELVERKFPKNIKNIQTLAILYYNWIIGIETLTRDAVIRRAYCIERALSMMPFLNMIIDEDAHLKDPAKGMNVATNADAIKVAEFLWNQQQAIT